MMRSLRSRLTLSLIGMLVLSLAALSLVVHVVVARALERQLDSRLLDEAGAVAEMAEDDRGATEFEAESLPDFERGERPAYFQAWLEDGTVIARSPMLGTRDLQRGAARSEPTFAAVTLPDGRVGRAAQLRRNLRIEPQPGQATEPARSQRSVIVVVARGTEDMDETLAAVRRWLFAFGTLTLVGASCVAILAVGRGLRPVRALSAELENLDVARLGRLSSPDLPSELAPLVEKLNELLARVETSFARERRFTADVSHELRTPLAALRMTLDVVGSRERAAPELAQALVDVNVVVRQMQVLCENLLALASLDAGSVPVRAVPVSLRRLVEDCWVPLEEAARRRELRFLNELDEALVAVTDPDQLRVVVANLLSNAVAYTKRGGTIEVRRPPSGEGALFEVRDSGPPIREAHLPHIFERFFRADPARGEGVHCGIGLALVRGISQVLGLDVTVENTSEGGVSFAVHRQT
ncbi:MAG TPA: ATP-binding protein [Polyangia bacterium]|jgi:two-component system sensor histidine kinase QseC|nr:ATP-binding protein [Polyangia bacterium]